jgi:formylglycine-generating enzyme required for sulfatase activity
MRATLLLLASCAGPAASSAHSLAPLSLAADERMIEIPAGKYIAGSTPEERAAAYDDYQASSGHDSAREHQWFEHEQPRHPATLPAFRIDLMPVTQAQYAEFVAAGQAPPPTIDEPAWRAQGFQQDYVTQVSRYLWKDGRPPIGREDHPVVLVTEDEANRYCRWRGVQHGDARRLPTADEYEKAARGEGGLPYPWGNSYEPDNLNSAVKGPKDTMPAGSFPHGASPYGVLELAGNVFEWTSTEYSTDQAAVKGSAWDDWGGVGRGAYTHGRNTTARHIIVGFRCAADR